MSSKIILGNNNEPEPRSEIAGNSQTALSGVAKKSDKCGEDFLGSGSEQAFFWTEIQPPFPLYFKFDEKETFYIADFYCFEKKLIIELDGKIHDFQKNRDTLRTEIINSRGIVVIRFRNEDIEKNCTVVLEKVRSQIE